MQSRSTIVALVTCGLMACSSGPNGENNASETAAPQSEPATSPASAPAPKTSGTVLAPPAAQGQEMATFAGGCFWCTESSFQKLPGVIEVYSGYTDGHTERPTYKEVGAGKTGHTEAVLVIFDPLKVAYPELVEVFWRSMDPTDISGQFADRGTQYRPAIYTHSEAQRTTAENSKTALQKSGKFSKDIVVPVLDAKPFWLAEDYHQDYFLTHPAHYKRYRSGSGRTPFLKETWGKEAH